jgi:hypothetical protein
MSRHKVAPHPPVPDSARRAAAVKRAAQLALLADTVPRLAETLMHTRTDLV